MKLLLLILTSLWIFVASAGETIRGFPYGRYNNSYITVKNGLPHNHVNDFFSDSNGFVWVATYGGGLVRYDGYGFIAPGIEGQSLQMRSNSCKNISEDRFRRLWVCFDENTRILDLNTMMNVTPHGRNIDIQKILLLTPLPQVKKAQQQANSFTSVDTVLLKPLLRIEQLSILNLIRLNLPTQDRTKR